MIWRDDDVLETGTLLTDLLAVDDVLQEYGCVHTIAILASTLTPTLGRVIRSRQMVPQLHGWAHDDLSVDVPAQRQLRSAVDRIADLCGARPTVLYPPWNRTSPTLERVAADLGLTVSAKKESLERIIRFPGEFPPSTIVNFHFWAASDRALLPEALAIAAKVPA